MRRPYEAKPWYSYRPIFLTEQRILGGVGFWRNNRELLERAESVYGVPPQIVTAIIGIESNYGGNLGKHRVIDALSTLGFSYAKRANFFRKELEQFLLLAREESVDVLEATGSYAGAVGMPQFIPSSYRAYAVDFDRDGRRDLWGSRADAIGSVGSYFQRHGWRRGEPVAFDVRVSGRVPKGIPVAEKKPRRPGASWGRLQAAGVTAGESLLPSTRVTLVRLDAPGPEYWLGLTNFYVITRYNHSNLYAMAVYQLSREIRAAYEKGAADPSARGKTVGLGE
jgi:membrane-bound lytic murein transglycosylase B